MKSRTVRLLLFACILVFSTVVQVYAQSDEDEAAFDYLKPPSVGAPSVIRVYFQDAEGLEALRAEFDVRQHGNHDIRDPYVLVEVTPDEYKQLLGRGYEMQLDLAQTAFFNQPTPYDARQLSGIPGFECYRTVVETFASLDSLNATYPDLVELDDVGDSWLKVQNAKLKPDGYIFNVIHSALYFITENKSLDDAIKFSGKANYCSVLVGAIMACLKK